MDLRALQALGKQLGVPVIEDCAQAIGTRDVTGAMVGSRCAIGTWSFFPTKNLGCFGDGGLCGCNCPHLDEMMRMLRVHGSKVRYYHKHVGMNGRLDALQAAVLRIKLRQLDAYGAARQAAAAVYDKAFAGMEHVHVPERSLNSTHVFHQYTLRITGGHRDALRAHLEKNGVPAMIYYPVPLHLQKAYEGYGIRRGDLPITERLMEEVLSLPMSTELDNEQLTHITATVKAFFN